MYRWSDKDTESADGSQHYQQVCLKGTQYFAANLPKGICGLFGIRKYQCVMCTCCGKYDDIEDCVHRSASIDHEAMTEELLEGSKSEAETIGSNLH